MKNEFDVNQMNRFLLEEYKRKAKIYKNQLLECREDKIKTLDKIRAEIAVLDDAYYDYEGYYKAVTDAVKIIDKYREEQE